MKHKQRNEKQKLIQTERPLPTERDDEIELIDLSTSFTSTTDEDLSKLNDRITVEQPVKWWINESGGSFRLFKDGRIEGVNKGIGEYHELCVEYPRDTSCLWRSIIGERVTPTQITSLLTQNLNETPRPASTFFWWKQPDEGHYIAKAKEGLAEFIAETRENYYLVPENSRLRRKFRCPEMGESFKDDCCRLGYFSGEEEDNEIDDGSDGTWRQQFLEQHKGDILIHVNPDNNQAVFYCPRCSKANSKRVGGDGKAVKHTIPRELRDELAKEGRIPPKRYKYHDRLSESGKLLDFIRNNQGMSIYELDQAMGWERQSEKRCRREYGSCPLRP
jgi:hypothetical protein